MNQEQIAKLKELAKAAAHHGDAIGEDEWYTADENASFFAPNPDLSLIAACSPVTILELIALAEHSLSAQDEVPKDKPQANPHATTFPTEIWLNVGDGDAHEVGPYKDLSELSWCWERIDKYDVRYVRADLAATAPSPAVARPSPKTVARARKIENENARFAIDAAMMFGQDNVNPPPTEDHWLMPYWKMAREWAEFKAVVEAATPSPSLAVRDGVKPGKGLSADMERELFGDGEAGAGED